MSFLTSWRLRKRICRLPCHISKETGKSSTCLSSWDGESEKDVGCHATLTLNLSDTNINAKKDSNASTNFIGFSYDSWRCEYNSHIQLCCVDTIPTTNSVKFQSVGTVQRNIYARLQTLSLLSIFPAVSPPPGIIQHERSTIIIILNIPFLYIFQNYHLK